MVVALLFEDPIVISTTTIKEITIQTEVVVEVEEKFNINIIVLGEMKNILLKNVIIVL